MEGRDPMDYYEILTVSPRADLETIEKVFKLLAKRYHPDNRHSGDVDRFNSILEAYRVLSDPKKRAICDRNFQRNSFNGYEALQTDDNDDNSSLRVEIDKQTRLGILSLLYAARKKDAENAGIGVMHLERLLGCTQKQMNFHTWYLKEKGWVQRLDTGEFAITALGVDALTDHEQTIRNDRLLPHLPATGTDQASRPRECIRMHERFPAKEGLIAILSGSAVDLLSGQIIEISRGGLAFSYLERVVDFDGLSMLEIYWLEEEHPLFTTSSYRKVYDIRSLNIKPDAPMRFHRCGVEFVELSQAQMERLDYLIANYTSKKLKN